MEESYGSTSLRRSYSKGNDGKLQVTSKKTSKSVSVSHFFTTVFLPQGYPDSVSEDYLTYQIWDTIQAFASSITGTLAAQAVLKGYGVGDESATVLAATLTWLLKDGTGMLGRIMFAWMQGTSLDCDAKRWRLFADIINDIAIFLEILGPHIPHLFTFIVCVSGVLKEDEVRYVGVMAENVPIKTLHLSDDSASLVKVTLWRELASTGDTRPGDYIKITDLIPSMYTSEISLSATCNSTVESIVGVSGGATRAALTQHQARRNNMADVSAKDGSQETLVNLAALICSFILVPIVTGRHILIWILYCLFTSLHLYANYSAVRGVVMETLNQARLHILLQEYFMTGTILAPNVANSREPVLWKTRRKLDIALGTSLRSFCDRYGEQEVVDIEDLLDVYKTSRYLLWINRKRGCIEIVLTQSAGVHDQFEACYHAELLNFLLEHHNSAYELPVGLQSLAQEVNHGTSSWLQATRIYVLKTFSQFLEDIHKQKWNTDISLLGADEWRLEDRSLQGVKNL